MSLQDYWQIIKNVTIVPIFLLIVKIKYFYKNVIMHYSLYGSAGDVITKDILNEQMISEVIVSFKNIINKLSKEYHKISVQEFLLGM